MRKFYVLASLLWGGLFCSQEVFSQQQDRIKEKLEDANGAPTFIKFKTNEKENFRPDQARQVLSTYLNLSAEDELKPVKQETDKEGFMHQYFAQYYKGIRVEYGSYNVHSKNGSILSINGEIKKVEKLSTKPAMAEKAEEVIQQCY